MSTQMPSKKRKWVLAGTLAIITLFTAMALDTTIIKNGSIDDLRKQAFSPDQYAKKEYPTIRNFVLAHAVQANTLLTLLQANKNAAIAKYGVKSGIGAIIPVKLKGTIKSGRSGIYKLNITNMPDRQTIRVQVGPAINGTALRDATGKVVFGEFKNQIQYQNVGSALNNEMKAKELNNIDQKTLVGKQVSIVGVFRLINAKNWLITPVRFDVK